MRWRRFATPTLRWSRPDSCRTRARRRATTGLVRFATAQTEAFDDFSVEPKAFIDAGDKVVVPLRFGGRASHTGLQVHFDVVHVCTARDGKWAQVDMYATESAALKAVGLQE